MTPYYPSYFRSLLLPLLSALVWWAGGPSVSAQAPTWTQQTAAGSRNWTSIACSASGLKLAAAHKGGSIWTSPDRGTTWTESGAAGAQQWVSITSSADGSKLAAAAGGGAIWTSPDSGASWVQRTGDLFWSSITGSADGSMLAATVGNGNIWTSADSGVNWTERTAPGNRAWNMITASADGSKLAAAGTTIWTSADSGATWTERTAAGARSWNDIKSSADGSKLVASVFNGGIWASGDSGATWTQLSAAGSRYWQAVSSSADGSILAAGDYSGPPTYAGGSIWISTDSGATWTAQTAAGSRNWKSIASSSDGILAPVAQFGYIWTYGSVAAAPAPTLTAIAPAIGSTAGGTSVTLTGTDFTGATGVTIGGTAATGLTVVSDTSITCTTPAGSAGTASVVVTTSSGSNAANTLFTYEAPVPPRTWVDQTAAGSRPWRSITSSADGSKLAAAATSGSIWTSTDSGTSWTERTAAGSRTWSSIASSADGSKLAAVVLGGDIWTSADSGATWTDQSSAGSRQWQSIASSADGSKLAAAVKYGGIWTSADSGATWTDQSSAGVRSWNSITSSADGSKLAAVVDGGYIWTSTDSGATWTERTSAGGFYWSAIASSQDGSKLVAVPNQDPIRTSTDGGVTWTDRGSPTSAGWVSVASSADGSRLVAGQYFGGLATSTDGGATWTTSYFSGGRNIFYGVASSSDGRKLAAADGNFGNIKTYVDPAPAPALTAIAPAIGSTAGGTSVTLTGTDFTGATGVTIGGTAATGLTVVSATSITCTTPAGSAGTASVVVTTPYGSTAANTLYTYEAVTTPLVALEAYVKSSNTAAGSTFGFSVAIAGDTAIIGAPHEASNATGVNGNQANTSAPSSGAAYVFTRSGTTWTQQAYLKASNTAPYSTFGSAVAIMGDTVIVSAPGERSNATGVNGNQADTSASYAGAVYVFTRSGTVWTQQAYLKASNSEAGDAFGRAVSVSGDTVVVGAASEGSSAVGIGGNQADNSASFSGAAYVFTRSGTVWTQQAYLKASNTQPNSSFGSSVTVAGDTVVVGAPYENGTATGVNGSQADNSGRSSGAAYVFTRSGTVWTQQAYLKSSNSENRDSFGDQLAMSGNTLVVSAPGEAGGAAGVNGDEADNSVDSAGAAYVFVRSGSTWTQQAYLKASTPDLDDAFGTDVAIADDTVVVGAMYESSNASGVNGDQEDNSSSSSGAAYVFTRSGTTWTQQAYLKASNTSHDDLFGKAVAVSGGTVLAGAPFEDSNATGIGGNQVNDSAGDSGAAYFFTGLGPVAPVNCFDGTNLGAIPARSFREVRFDVAGFTQSITDVSVELTLNPACAFTIDLDIRIIAPDGTSAILSGNQGDSNDFAGPYTFTDTAATQVTSIGPVLPSGSYKPKTPLADLAGTGANGIWKLRISDRAANNSSVSFAKLCLNPGGSVPVPTVTAIAPAEGQQAGCTAVTITGTGFTGATGVTIGGIAATAVMVVNDTTITCTTPAGPAGTASVVVTAGGSNAANTLFTYLPGGSSDCFVGTNLGPLADRSTRNVAFAVSGVAQPIVGVTASFTFSPAHTWASDLQIRLIGPDGTSVQLTGNSGSSSHVAGPYTFTDLGSAPWGYSMGSTIAAGEYKAVTPLAAFAGKSANGAWTLEFKDTAGGDTGTISAASICFVSGPAGDPDCHEGSNLGAIPPAGSRDVTFLVAGATQPVDVAKLEVSFNPVNPNAGDLTLSLIAPDGTTVILTQNQGGSTDAAGPYLFTDEATTSWTATGDFVPTGSYAPQGPLSALTGKAANGTWILRIADRGAANASSVACAKLCLTIAPPRPPDYVITIDEEGALVLTDVTDNSDTLTISEGDGTIKIGAPGRVFKLGDAAATTDLFEGPIGLRSPITSITLVLGAGTDVVECAGLAALLPDVTILGSDVLTTVNIRGSLTFQESASLSVNLRMDPGHLSEVKLWAGTITTSETGNISLQASKITSLTGAGLASLGEEPGDIDLTGSSITLGSGPLLADTPPSILSPGGRISLIADSITLVDRILAGAGEVFLSPTTEASPIHLGASAGTGLTLLDSSLDMIYAITVTIGDAASGDITVSEVVSPAKYYNLVLDGNVTFTATAGFASLAGYVAANYFPYDPTPTADIDWDATDYAKVSVLGSVVITPGATVSLEPRGGYITTPGAAYTLLANDEADPINGQFIGPRLRSFLGTASNAAKTYIGGSGNDFVITNSLPVPGFLLATNLSAPKLNYTTGLMEYTLRVTNNSAVAVEGVQIGIGNMVPETLLWNRTHPLLPIIEVISALAPGATLDVKIEIYSNGRNLAGWVPTYGVAPMASMTTDPSSKDLPTAGGSYDVTIVTAGIWRTTSLAWATISPESGVGNDTVTITVQPNPSVTPRTGDVRIGSKMHRITQAGAQVPAFVGMSASYTTIVSQADLSIPLTLSNGPATFVATGLPPGLKLVTQATSNGPQTKITGIPSKAGSYNVTVKASNKAGPALSPAVFVIRVLPLSPGVIGNFTGIIDRNANVYFGTRTNVGSVIDLTTSATGAITGKITEGSTRYPFKGQLLGDPGDADYATAEILVGDATLSLSLSDDEGYGSVRLPGVVGRPFITLSRNAWSSSRKPTAYSGKAHTFSLGNASPASGPQGYGFASFTVNASTGSLTLSGKLADGSALLYSTFIGQRGYIPVYQPLYGNRGSVHGSVEVNGRGNTDLSDNTIARGRTLSWFKPATTVGADNVYRSGFSINFGIEGGAYIPPAAGQRVLGLSAGASNTVVAFYTADAAGTVLSALLATIANPKPTGLTNTIVIPANADSIVMPSFSAATGALGGSFGTGLTKAPYFGQIIRKADGQSEGRGYYLQPQPPTAGQTPATAPQLSGKFVLSVHEEP